MFSRTIIYLDVAAAGSSVDFSQIWHPLSSPSRSFKSCAPWELVLSEPTLADSKVLFAICSTNAIRAGMSIIFLCLPPHPSILSSTGIKSTRNCNCKPTIRSKYGFFRVSTKILIISFSSRGGRARGRHFFSTAGRILKKCLPAPSNGRSSSAVNTIRPMPIKGALESLDHQGFIVCVLGHLPAVHLQVNHRVVPPIVTSQSFGTLNLGGIVMLGNQDMLEKSVFRKSFGGVGGLGSRSMLMRGRPSDTSPLVLLPSFLF
uniref:Uncharacterized protein n=1 Tax=Fagus sylvatica TaxID=28930 RepID=A0A2N9IP14_FAGSY